MKIIKNENFNEAMFNINNEMILNENVTDMDISIYSCMKSFIGFNMCATVNMNMVYEMLSFNDRSVYKKIKESLLHLMELEYIGCYDITMNEMDVTKIKPNDMIVVYFGEDGVWNAKNKTYQEYFPVTQLRFRYLLDKCKESNAKCKFIRFGLIVYRTLNYNSCMIPWITFSGIKNVVGNQNTMNTYLNLMTGVIHFENSFINDKGKRCSTFVISKSDMSYDEFYRKVKNSVKAEGYKPMNESSSTPIEYVDSRFGDSIYEDESHFTNEEIDTIINREVQDIEDEDMDSLFDDIPDDINVYADSIF